MKIADYGRTLSGKRAAAPVDAPGRDSPSLEYRMYLFTAGPVEVNAITAPTLNFVPGRGLLYAVSIDDEPPQIVTLVPEGYQAQNRNAAWETSVADNAHQGLSRHQVAAPGYHTLRIWMIDPAVVMQKLVVDLGGLKPSYLGPMESYRGSTPVLRWRSATKPLQADLRRKLCIDSINRQSRNRRSRLPPPPVLPLPPDGGGGGGGGGLFALNVAVTLLAALSVTMQSEPAPAQSPDQPPKTAFTAGVAVSVTRVPSARLAAQGVLPCPQLMPPGDEVTLPMLMSPATVTFNACMGGAIDANVAVTLLAASMTTMQVVPVPLQLPDHPVKVPLAAAVTVNVTTVLRGMLAAQCVAP